MMRPRLARVAVGCLLVTLLPAAAFAQSGAATEGWDTAVREFASGYVAELASQGAGDFEIDDMVTGSLRAAQADTFDFLGQAGKTYVIFGICDDDCTDIDLAVEDQAGYSQGHDMEPDDFPLVEFVTADEVYDYELHMVSCSVQPCFFGVVVLRESGGAVATTGPDGDTIYETSDEWDAVVQDITGDYLERLASNGEEYEVMEILTGAAWPGESATRIFIGTAARNYVVAGICDEDCHDIDLFVETQDGATIGSDIEDDKFPVVDFASQGLDYRFTLSMHGCAVGPCEWAVLLLRESRVP